MPKTEFINLLEAGDFEGCRAAITQAMPHLPPIRSREGAEATMHYARTGLVEVSFKARAYSHAWLVERGLPSALPDELKPRAERLYPRVVSAVGISVQTSRNWLRPAADAIHKAMTDAVEDIAADGKLRDDELVGRRLREAREQAHRKLFG